MYRNLFTHKIELNNLLTCLILIHLKKDIITSRLFMYRPVLLFKMNNISFIII